VEVEGGAMGMRTSGVDTVDDGGMDEGSEMGGRHMNEVDSVEKDEE